MIEKLANFAASLPSAFTAFAISPSKAAGSTSRIAQIPDTDKLNMSGEAVSPNTGGAQVVTARSIKLAVRIARERLTMGLALLRIAAKAFTRPLSPATRKVITRNLSGIVLRYGDPGARANYRKEHGHNPPLFLAISPGKACNLRCAGCYADAGSAPEKLEWDTFNRILTEAKNSWGVRFFVISGGEPLAYRSEGKGVLDAAALHPDCLFLMFTNGTLINEYVARRIAALGNLTPAISVEGWRKQTDARRGAGVFDKVLAAMERLRREKALFGISVTATCKNAEDLLSDEFIDFFFEEQGALYQWIFHYLPIGRSAEVDLMPTPEQRLWMWRRTWELITGRHLFLADFWNHGTTSWGCLSAGMRDGNGYLHIDWNGAVSPCVFMPYSPVNVRDVFAQGKALDEVLSQPFFNSLRSWQRSYARNGGNWMTPCPVRDHYGDLVRIVATHQPQLIRHGGLDTAEDPDYALRMIAYGKACHELTQPIWAGNYLKIGSKQKEVSFSAADDSELGQTKVA